MVGTMIKNFKRDKISVALCTYNGEYYLQQQLESIINQSVLPDEIVVCDDSSTDNTVDILKNFSKNSPVPLRIYINEKNLGVSKNFERAISLCVGDIIFLSDQDDVWLPYKIEKIVQKFDSNKDCTYVFSDAFIVDSELGSMGYKMWESIDFNRSQRKKFSRGYQLDILLKHNVVTGATMAFRSSLRKVILPISELWIHDAWIALLGSIVGRGCFIEEPLIYYRQHTHQLIGGKKVGVFDRVEKSLSTGISEYILDIKRYEILDGRIFEVKGSYNNKVEDKISFLKQRQEIYEHPQLLNLIVVVCELFNGRYRRYQNGFGSALKDAFIILKSVVVTRLRRVKDDK